MFYSAVILFVVTLVSAASLYLSDDSLHLRLGRDELLALAIIPHAADRVIHSMLSVSTTWFNYQHAYLTIGLIMTLVFSFSDWKLRGYITRCELVFCNLYYGAHFLLYMAFRFIAFL